SAPALPAVTSGSLNLWLKADAGVVANGSGQVSAWLDQSSNAFNAYQTNSAQQPTAGTDAFPGGARSVVRFNGLPFGDFMYGSSNLNSTGGLTTFCVYYNPTIDDHAKSIMMIGRYNAATAVRS